MSTRRVTINLCLFMAAMLIAAGFLARVGADDPPPSFTPADGGSTLVAPPPALVPQNVSVNATSFRYVSPVYARDLPAYDLSRHINWSAHRYRISPVGLLAVIWSECSLYTQSPRCDRYGPWPDWSHGACQVIVQTAAQFGIGDGTEASDARVKAFEDDPARCINLAARVLRSMKNATHVSFPQLAIVWNCGSLGAYVYGSQCYTNHQTFLQYWAMAAAKGANHRSVTAAAPGAIPSGCVNGQVPCGQIFGLTGIPYIVQSQFAYEASLLPGGAPVADTDYILPYGVQEPVHLPGGKWNHFTSAGVVNVIGSGCVARVIAAGDIEVDFLHLQCGTVVGLDRNVGAIPTIPAPPVFQGETSLDGDERTALAAAPYFAKTAPQAGGTVLHGGQVIGLSRWPDWAIYGNGSFGPQDAHLCVLYNQAALNYFWKVATGQDHPPKPPPFPVKAWRTWTATHHRKSVSFRDKHHHLRPEARYWWHTARWLGGVTSEERWYRSKRHPSQSHEVMSFAHGAIWYYPKSGRLAAYKHKPPKRHGT